MTAAASAKAAVLLAGGRASRMGGIDKPALEVRGRTLLERALDAVRGAGCAPVVIVGPRPEHKAVDDTDATGIAVEWAREDPPFSGPAAAVVAGLAAMAKAATQREGAGGGAADRRSHETAASTDEPEWTFLLACDLPRAQEAVGRLAAWIAAAPTPHTADGACLVDASGRGQWLTGVYRTSALREAAASVPDDGRDASVRSLLAGLDIEALTDTDHVADDVDTWDDFDRITKEKSHG